MDYCIDILIIKVDTLYKYALPLLEEVPRNQVFRIIYLSFSYTSGITLSRIGGFKTRVGRYQQQGNDMMDDFEYLESNPSRIGGPFQNTLLLPLGKGYLNKTYYSIGIYIYILFSK